MKYKNEEMIDDGTCPFPYVPGTPPRKPTLQPKDFYGKFSKLKTKLGSSYVDGAARATEIMLDGYFEENMHEISSALEDMASEISSFPFLVSEHLRAASKCARQIAIDADYCPDCGSKLKVRYIEDELVVKHCSECRWDEEDE